MPPSIESLRRQRELLLRDMQAIDHLRRGCLSKQYFKPAPGQSARRGPYFILQGFFCGKKFNERVPAAKAPQVQEQVDNYKRFQALAEQYVTVSDEITRLESPEDLHDGKKNFSRRKSPTNASRKPTPS